MSILKDINKLPLKIIQQNGFININNIFNGFISSYDFLAYRVDHQIRENEIKYSDIINFIINKKFS